MKILPLIMVLTCVAWLSGCAAKPPIPETLALQDLNAKQGLLVGALSRPSQKIAFNSYTLLFRNIDNGETYKVVARCDPMSGRYEDDFVNAPAAGGQLVNGSQFAILVPAGRYEMYNYYLHKMEPNGDSVTYSAKEEFSIPFEVNGSEIKYIGEFRNVPDTFMHTWLGIETEVLAGGSWDIYDGSNRDAERLKGRFPAMPWSQMKVALLTPTSNLALLVRRGKESRE